MLGNTACKVEHTKFGEAVVFFGKEGDENREWWMIFSFELERKFWIKFASEGDDKVT